MNTTLSKTTTMVIVAMFTAIAAVLSALPSFINILGVPATLQTFAMSFLGFLLGRKNGTMAVVLYILLGAVGLPVFSGFKGGLSVLFGITGGFIFGFLFLAFLCGLSNKYKNIVIKVLLSLGGLLICHLLGIIQFSFITKTNLWQAASLVSVSYIPKDILSVILAYFLALATKKALASAKLNIPE